MAASSDVGVCTTVVMQVPFFSDDKDTATTPKADALYIPRENPRALVICPTEQWSTKAHSEKTSLSDRSTAVNENGNILD